MPAFRRNGRSFSTPWRLTPRLAGLLIGLPGNHDVNVVDRANPARLDLPTSPTKRLRQLRTVSALAALQGTRVKVVDAHLRPARRHAGASPGAASRRNRSLRGQGIDPPVAAPGRSVGGDLSDGAAARHRGWAGSDRAELERRHALLLHQCARNDVDRAGEGHRHRGRPVPPRLLDRGAPPPRRRVSQARQGAVRADRYGARSTAAGSCGVCSAWPTTRWSCTATGISTGSASAAGC